MPVFSEERAYLIAAAEELESYLLSGAATWRLAGPDSFPPLTLGNVLLAMKRLSGLSEVVAEHEKIQEALDSIDHVRLRWRSIWMARIRQEIPQRLRLWSNYLDGLIQDRYLAHQEYPWNVRWRAILALVEQEIGGLDPQTGQNLIVLDERLRVISLPGPFVWEEGLARIFEPANFWFLYVKISRPS
jgi:hypothetical protein